jgi:Ribbon-helix-helix protein, copG family
VAEPAPPRIVRVTVNLPVKIWEAITGMADDRGVSKTEALRRCVSTEVWRRDAEARGARFFEEYEDGSRIEVRFPW